MTRTNVHQKTYQAWLSLRKRCRSAKGYADLDISWDVRWNRYENFLADMGEAPEGKSLDREDGNFGYSKGNCRWATPKEQSRNRSCNQLNEETAALVKKRLKEISGTPFAKAKKIATEFSVSWSCVQGLIEGKSWADIQEAP